MLSNALPLGSRQTRPGLRLLTGSAVSVSMPPVENLLLPELGGGGEDGWVAAALGELLQALADRSQPIRGERHLVDQRLRLAKERPTEESQDASRHEQDGQPEQDPPVPRHLGRLRHWDAATCLDPSGSALRRACLP